MQTYSNKLAFDVFNQIRIAFPPEFAAQLQNGLQKPVNEALRIAIRMHCEPTNIMIFYPRVGIGWASDFHVHRNPELQGQILSDDKSPWVVRCTMFPLIKIDYLKGDIETTVHKGEVILCERKRGLRPFHKLPQ